MKISKLNELKLNKLKIILSLDISFVIVEFLTKINQLLIIVEKYLIEKLLIKFDEFLMNIDEFFAMTKSFEIETKYETIV